MRGMKEMMSCDMKIEKSNEMCILGDGNEMNKRNYRVWRDAEIKSCYHNLKKEQAVVREGSSHPLFLRSFFHIASLRWVSIWCYPSFPHIFCVGQSRYPSSKVYKLHTQAYMQAYNIWEILAYSTSEREEGFFWTEAFCTPFESNVLL